jgi:DNA-binding LacI/PurR family transcriptional regulator
MATEKLLENGHRRIGYIGATGGSNSGRERWRGFCKALESQGLDPADMPVYRGPFSAEFGHRAVSDLVASGKDVSAVYLGNHEAALGAIPEIRRQSVAIPDRWSVVAHEDADLFSSWVPGITIVDSRPRDMASKAIELLVREMEDGITADADLHRIEPRLVERESTMTRSESES